MRHFTGIRCTDKAGFTLIELLVVVLVLGALAAIIVPRFIGIEEMAEDAAASMNVGTVNETINGHVNLTGRIPNGLDSLINGGSQNLVEGPWVDQSMNPIITKGTLTNDEVTALSTIGLTKVSDGPYESESFIDYTDLTAGGPVGRISQDIDLFVGGQFQPVKDCLVFGLGTHIQPYAKAIPSGSASVTFEKPGIAPGIDANFYRRYLLLVRVETTNAQIVGCINPTFESVN